LKVLLLGGEVLITMIIDRAKRRVFSGQLTKEGTNLKSNNKQAEKLLSGNPMDGLYVRYGEIISNSENNIAVLNDTTYFYEEQFPLHKYWNISPSADGTVANPTLSLDYRWNKAVLFIDISSYAATIELPDPTEVPVGWTIKFILSEASQDEATKNFGVITHDANTDMQGYIGGGADIAVTKQTSSVYWDTSDAAASGGDWCEVITDGTGWYITGQAALANSVDIANGRDVTT